MRYDTPIYFQREPEKTYDPLTGNYVKDEPVEVKRYANVTDASSVSKLFEFGKEYEQGLVVRIQGRYQEPISFIRVGSKRYTVKAVRHLRNSQVFLVSEVM